MKQGSDNPVSQVVQESLELVQDHAEKQIVDVPVLQFQEERATPKEVGAEPHECADHGSC